MPNSKWRPPFAALRVGATLALATAVWQAPAFGENQKPPAAGKPGQPVAADAAQAGKEAGKQQGKPSEANTGKQENTKDRTQNSSNPVEAANGSEPAIPPAVEWSFTGMFGRYDLAQLQRGFQIYKQVCSTCHSLKLVAFRNLTDLGYSGAQVKALAGTYEIEDGPNDQGQMFKRKGRPSDYFPSPFPNVEAAKAAYGKAPPDMSTLAKARGWERGFPLFLLDFFTQTEEGEGPTYIHAILNGYTKKDDPKWNLYMQNHRIAMPKPLSDGQVQYTDGSPQTLDQYSKDVAAFLMWAAEPKLEARKAMGLRVMIFLVVFSSLLYFVKKRIWARVGGDVVVDAPSSTTSDVRGAKPSQSFG